MIENIITFSVIFFSGIVVGVISYTLFCKYKQKTLENLGRQIIHQAEKDASALKHRTDVELKEKRLDQQREIDHYLQLEKKKLSKENERLQIKEDKVETRTSLLEKKSSDLEKREEVLQKQLKELVSQVDCNTQLKKKLESELEVISGLSASEAKDHLKRNLLNSAQHETSTMIRRMFKDAEDEAEKKAKSIIATTLSRIGTSTLSEATVNMISLPSQEIKGRIVGREGRNIRALERALGVNLVLDDTPGTLLISTFDPIRMQVAKLTLQELIADGRIHPSRIEEAVEKSQQQIEKLIKQNGEDAAFRIGVANFHPEIITLLGKLKYRYSYGQNILEHSLEVAKIMGVMAGELGLDIRLAKRIGLLHDMGKALSHEMEGSHAIIGRDFAIKYGESQDVAIGIGCHHGEIPPTTIEGSLCSLADALSATRPGGRVEAVEQYINRLKKLEEMAFQYPGIEQAFALQAGRELRVIVMPEVLDDNQTLQLARDLTKRIEKELTYPGKIKVTVIREKMATEYAL